MNMNTRIKTSDGVVFETPYPIETVKNAMLVNGQNGIIEALYEDAKVLVPVASISYVMDISEEK